VTTYRILTLGPASGPNRKIVSKNDIECATEEVAITQAEQLLDRHDTELWEHGRFIEFFKSRTKGVQIEFGSCFR